ncbi:MAG: YecA family protein [Rubrivivax sp.]
MQAALDSLPPPLEPLDAPSLDGFLCGVLLQPDAIASARWLPHVVDLAARAPPAGFDLQPLHSLVLRRASELDTAIEQRQWFDPWLFEYHDSTGPSASVLPWAAGFAAAMELFPALMRVDDAELLEPLALLYMHFDADDLEDADALREVIDSLEPPADLAEAAQDLVRSVLLIADVTRPLPR